FGRRRRRTREPWLALAAVLDRRHDQSPDLFTTGGALTAAVCAFPARRSGIRPDCLRTILRILPLLRRPHNRTEDRPIETDRTRLVDRIHDRHVEPCANDAAESRRTISDTRSGRYDK